MTEVQSKDPTYELVASFRVDVGDQDQVVHIWRYQHGYPKASEIRQLVRTDAGLAALVKDQDSMLRQRQNQFMMAFSFWGHPVPAVRDSYYEMRSYILKPGTMIEWGNNWYVVVPFVCSLSAGCCSLLLSLHLGHHFDRLINSLSRTLRPQSVFIVCPPFCVSIARVDPSSAAH